MRTTRALLAPLILLTAIPARAADSPSVTCEGTYAHHLQGVCTNGRDAIYWCFTTQLVKTDAKGKALKQVAVANHHGDLCFQKGKVYVAVNLGKFNDPEGNADSWVYVYDASDLSLLARHKVAEVFHGAGGIASHDGRFLVVGGLPEDGKENYAYEYDADFQFVKKHALAGGHTLMGIQTAAFARGQWWFGCYGEPKILLRADASLKEVERFRFDCSLGIVSIGDGQFLVGRGGRSKGKGHTGRLVLAQADEEQGLKVIVATGATGKRK
jgi:hypothetical protein